MSTLKAQIIDTESGSLTIKAATNTVMTITATGNVGIANTTPGYALTVNGTIECTNGIVYSDGSKQMAAMAGTFRGANAFSGPVAVNFTAPPTSTFAKVTVVGGGGSGGLGAPPNQVGGSGGGGGTAILYTPVTGGSLYKVVSGGTGGTSAFGPPAAPPATLTTAAGWSAVATGGGTGTAATPTTDGTAGAGGTGSGGTINFTGITPVIARPNNLAGRLGGAALGVGVGLPGAAGNRNNTAQSGVGHGAGGLGAAHTGIGAGSGTPGVVIVEYN